MDETPVGLQKLDAEIEAMSHAEIKAYRDFTQVYRFQHPEPVKDKQTFGWEFYSAILTSVSAVILAAFRTGQAFYLAAAGSSNFLFAFAEALVAVLAIEGSVVLFALRSARRRESSDDMLSETVGLWIAFGVSVLAGLYQSINLLLTPSDTVSNFLNYALVVAMGVGATTIAWLGGSILGVQLVRLEKFNKEANEHYALSMIGYRSNMLKEWRKSGEQRAILSQKDRRYVEREPVREPISEPVHRQASAPRSERSVPSASKDEIYAVFDRVYAATNTVPGVNQTARELAKARSMNGEFDEWQRFKGTVSEHRKRWLAERGLEGFILPTH